MYKVNYDNLKNRVYVTVTGSLELNEIDNYTKEFKAVVDRTKPGFTVCVDNTNAALNSPEVNDKLMDSRNYSVQKGLKNAAMVVNSTIFKMQMKRLFNELGNVFQTKEEADKFLDTAPQI